MEELSSDYAELRKDWGDSYKDFTFLDYVKYYFEEFLGTYTDEQEDVEEDDDEEESENE